MKENNQNKALINVAEKDGQQVVSARELYSFLEVKTDFTDWCKRMFEYGFIENQDFTILLKNGENKISKSNPIDYALTLDTAKEISMIQRTEKGKQARQYFIECEKQLKSIENKDSTELIELREKVNFLKTLQASSRVYGVTDMLLFKTIKDVETTVFLSYLLHLGTTKHIEDIEENTGLTLSKQLHCREVLLTLGVLDYVDLEEEKIGVKVNYAVLNKLIEVKKRTILPKANSDTKFHSLLEEFLKKNDK